MASTSAGAAIRVCRWRCLSVRRLSIARLHRQGTSLPPQLPPQQGSTAAVAAARSSDEAEAGKPPPLHGYFNAVSSWYESLIGLDEVRRAQQAVLAAEERFLDSQQARRALQQQQLALGMERDRLELEMDKYQKGEDKYLQLILREHDLIKSEQSLTQKVQTAEHEERKKFAHLSAAFRASHEQERAHSDRTKYWTLIGSVAGTLLGVGAASLHRWLRLREAAENQRLAENLRSQTDQLNHLLASLATASSSASSDSATSPTPDQSAELERLLDAGLRRTAAIAGGAVIGGCALAFFVARLTSS